MITGPWKSYF